MSCACKVGPGKFEGEPALTFMAHAVMLEGFSDATTGEDGDTIDWFRAPLGFDADADLSHAARAHGYCQECIEHYADDVNGGVAIWEDSNGFVYCKTFATVEEFDAALAEAEEEESSEEEEGE